MDWMIQVAGLITAVIYATLAIRKDLRETEKHRREMGKDNDDDREL